MDPELVDQLIRDLVLESLFAQQDVTDVSRRQEGPETGTVPEFLQMLGEIGLDFTPGVGDVKAAAFDAPRQFGEGQNLAGIISLLSAIPGAGILGDLLRRTRFGRGASDKAGSQAFENLIERRGASPSAARTGETARRSTGARAVEDILSETGGEPGEEAFGLLIERLGGTGGTQSRAIKGSDFNVSDLVDDALERLSTGRQGLARTDEEVARIRKSLDDLFGS